MNFLTFMFSSVYDQASLAVMAVGLCLNGLIDLVKASRARGAASS